MRDKLIELLESAESAVYWDSSDQSFVNKIADHLIANGVTFAEDNNVPTKWISVSESLPERAISINGRIEDESDEVLAFIASTGAMFIAEYWHDEAVWTESTELRWLPGVTHWMPLPNYPLPEPPKEGE